MTTTTLKVSKKKTSTTKATTTKNEIVPEVAVAAAAPPTVVAPIPVVATPVATIVAPVTESPEIIEEITEGGNVIRIKKRRIATRDEFLQSFDEMAELINNEITTSKDDKNVNGKSLKFLRNINKNLVTLKKDAQKLIRVKRKSTASEDGSTSKDSTNKVSSGFLKPVPISNAMASFTGWAPTELKSRVDVTKFLCSYIKDNNLQNPVDRRQILLDQKLSKLLDYKEGTPLTYFDMQSHLKKHFPKTVIKA